MVERDREFRKMVDDWIASDSVSLSEALFDMFPSLRAVANIAMLMIFVILFVWLRTKINSTFSHVPPFFSNRVTPLTEVMSPRQSQEFSELEKTIIALQETSALQIRALEHEIQAQRVELRRLSDDLQ